MAIAIFGLGYVGTVTAACLAKEGHRVIGVDVATSKIDMINAGLSPVIEGKIEDLTAEAVASGHLVATNDIEFAIGSTDLCLVCVGTPSLPNGAIDTRPIASVCHQIGDVIKTLSHRYLIGIRSTITPGTMRDLVIPTLEYSSGGEVGGKFEAIFHPEFLREGSSVEDFYAPARIVIGERYPGAGQSILDLYAKHFEAPRIVCSIETAETIKYCDNIFHALKVTFANEIGQFCHVHGIDSREVMRIFCQDRKLNLSDRYLRPGFAFGGSCLPKDLRAFLSAARQKGLTLQMLDSILTSNQNQMERGLHMIMNLHPKKIGLYGLAFKYGTDDLRESPNVEVAERLIGKGYKLVVYDKYVRRARLIGGNKSYIEHKLPHLAQILTEDIGDFGQCDLIVIVHPLGEDIVNSWLDAGKKILDFTGTIVSESADIYTIV